MISSKYIIPLVVLIGGVLYQAIIKPVVLESFGIFRSVQPLSNFPYSCRRIYHKDLEACEDIWLDEADRTLYAACSNSENRLAWRPQARAFNVSGRHLTDHVSVLNIDEPGNDGLFGLRILKPTGYTGATGDASLDLLGFDAEILDDNTVRLFLVNDRPSMSPSGTLLDQYSTGTNSTIEIFDVKRGTTEMAHVRTVSSRNIWSPNNIAADGKGGFYYTNDRISNTDPIRTADLVLGGGNVGYCSPEGRCRISQYFGFTMPNGLVRGTDDLIYVPSSFYGKIRVMKADSENRLEEIDVVKTGMPLDNLAVDSVGDIWAAGFPKSSKILAMLSNPREVDSPSTIFRIKREESQYKVDKIVEDRDGEVISGATTVRHDVKTGRLFMGSVVAPFLVVCDPR